MVMTFSNNTLRYTYPGNAMEILSSVIVKIKKSLNIIKHFFFLVKHKQHDITGIKLIMLEVNVLLD